MSSAALKMGPHDESRHVVSLALNTLLLIAIYTAYGVLQERIMKGEYQVLDQDGELVTATFTSSPLLVLCNRLTSLFTAILIVMRRPSSSHIALPGNASRDDGSIAAMLFSRLDQLRPASPLNRYALISFLNNAATTAQYTSLSYLSFTTTTLGKSAKMIPALIIGTLLYKKQYKTREYVGVAVVMAGITGYLNALPKHPAQEHDDVAQANWIGVVCLVSYLFFDGLTSTTQEWLFDKAKKDPTRDGGEQAQTFMGLTPAVMDQMIWVNLFSSLVAFGMLLLGPEESAARSLFLARNSPTLQLHILLLSITATCGLLVLFHVISTYGALISGLIMTVRQFVSVVCNAVWFGNMKDIPLSGWAYIGLFAAGVWIKIDRRYDPPKRSPGQMKIKDHLVGSLNGEKNSDGANTNQSGTPRLVRQYLLPLAVCPIMFVLLFATFTSLPSFMDGQSPVGNATRSAVSAANATNTRAIATPTMVTKYVEHIPDFQRSESGNLWDEKMIDMLDPVCPPGPLNSVRYNTTVRTALATYPRSGSSYTRTLIERATGYLTSSLYCDPDFKEFFLAECDYEDRFLQKTHYPSALKHNGEHNPNWFHEYDRYLEIVRNPIDVIWSLENMLLTFSQANRIEMKFTMANQTDLKLWLDEWNAFINYWQATPIPGHVIRYEDMRRSPMLHVMDIVAFLLPEEDLPPLSRIACAMQLDREKEMYPSGKNAPFHNWEKHFDNETFNWMIEQVAENWCKFGYDQLLHETHGTYGPVDCLMLRVGVPREAMMDGRDWKQVAADAAKAGLGRKVREGKRDDEVHIQEDVDVEDEEDIEDS